MPRRHVFHGEGVLTDQHGESLFSIERLASRRVVRRRRAERSTMPLTMCGNDDPDLRPKIEHLTRVLCIQEGVPGHLNTEQYRDHFGYLAKLIAAVVHEDLTGRTHLGARLDPVRIGRGEDVVLVPIMRAGIPMLPAFLGKFPQAQVGVTWMQHISRDGIEPVIYCERIPSCVGKLVLILDQVVSTGRTISSVIDGVMERGGRDACVIAIVTAFASKEAARRFSMGNFHFYAAMVEGEARTDHDLVPGPGNAGNRWCGIA